jgi:hypothetical protein
MATLRIPNVPESVRDTLTQRAKSRGLSLRTTFATISSTYVREVTKRRCFDGLTSVAASLPKIDIRSLIDRSDDGRF